MVISTAKYKKLIFLMLLAVLGSGAFSVFSNIEMNVFLKGYGLLLVLQTGFALIYLSCFHDRDRKS